MSKIIALTPSARKGVGIINEIDNGKFHLLVSRFLQKFHDKENEIFNADEREKLSVAFNLEADAVNLVLETLFSILEQVTYNVMKPAILAQQLRQLELKEEKNSAIVEAWTNNARNVVTKLSKLNVTPSELEDVKWRLNLQMAQGNRAQLSEPIAQFQLGVKHANQKELEKIMLEFNHDELFAFYNKLEEIQTQLDSFK